MTELTSHNFFASIRCTDLYDGGFLGYIRNALMFILVIRDHPRRHSRSKLNSSRRISMLTLTWRTMDQMAMDPRLRSLGHEAAHY